MLLCNSYNIVISFLHNIYVQAEGTGIYIRQISSAHVTTDIYHFEHSNKNHPNLKTTAQLLYIVTDADYDCRMFLTLL